MPYIVRLETGTINRAIYQTAILRRPGAVPGPEPCASASGLERPARLHLRRRLPGGLVPPGRHDRRRARTT